jgi:hypothetical protein
MVFASIVRLQGSVLSLRPIMATNSGFVKSVPLGLDMPGTSPVYSVKGRRN